MSILAAENDLVNIELKTGERFLNCQILNTTEKLLSVQIPFVKNAIEIPQKDIRILTPSDAVVKSDKRSVMVYASVLRPISNQSALQNFFPYMPSADIIMQWGNLKAMPWLGNITTSLNGLFLTSNSVNYQIYHLFAGTTYEKNITKSGRFSAGLTILLGPGYNRIQGYNGNVDFFTLAAQTILFSTMRVGQNSFLLGLQIGYNYDRTYIFLSSGISAGFRFIF